MRENKIIDFGYLRRLDEARYFLERIFKDKDPQKASGKKLMSCTKIEGREVLHESWEWYICGFCDGETGGTVEDDKIYCHTCGAVISKTGGKIHFPRYGIDLIWTSNDEYII